MIINRSLKAALFLGILSASTLFAQVETVIPSVLENPPSQVITPETVISPAVPAPAPAPVVTVPNTAPVQSVAVAAPTYVPCTPRTAEVFTVTSLEQCGRTLPNSGIRGVINRNVRRCTEETLVAEVYASKNTCEDCTTKQAVSELRCLRGECRICSNPEYLNALITDLASYSRAVRIAAATSLRLCKLHVARKPNACVTAETPSVLFYSDINTVASNLGTL